MQLVFEYADAGGSWSDLATGADGSWTPPDYSRCFDLCEVWIVVPSTDANNTLFSQQTNYNMNNCLLPVSGNANAQQWSDIQLSAQSPSTLYVVDTDCEDELSFAGGIVNWHGGHAISEQSPANWITTTQLEQLDDQGLLDESRGYENPTDG